MGSVFIFSVTLAVVFMFESGRQFREVRFVRATLLPFAAGLLFCLFASAPNFLVYRIGTTGLETIEVINRASLARPLPPSVPSELRAKIERSRAKEEYARSGILQTYRDSDGNVVTYTPTPAETKLREDMIATRVQMELLQLEGINRTFQPWLAGVVALLLGVSWSQPGPIRSGKFIIVLIGFVAIGVIVALLWR